MCVCVCECACVCVCVCVSECVCASRKGVGSGMAGKALAAPLFYFSFYVGGFVVDKQKNKLQLAREQPFASTARYTQ